MRILLLTVSLALFILAAFAALGVGSFAYASALIPAGLAFFIGSFLVRE